MALPELQQRYQLKEVNEYAHSFCTNFHKAGLVAFDCSTLFVRDRKLLTSALDVTPAFLRTKHGDTGAVIDYRNWQIAVHHQTDVSRVFSMLIKAPVTAWSPFPITQAVVRASVVRCDGLPGPLAECACLLVAQI